MFFGLLLAMFISSLSETIASTALPTIVGDLNGVEIMQWVSTAYILSSTLVMPVYGKLGDLIGRKRLLMAALALYAAGKMICGLSVNMGMLISGRLVSGLGGGGLIILSQATLSDVAPPRKLGTYMGVIGAVFAVSNVLGPLLGGWFVQVTGWRWIFWFTMRLTADGAGKLTHVDNLSLATLTPQIVDKLPASAQSVIAAGYSDALLPLFLWFVPLMLACLVMMLLLKRHPLATTINHGGAGK